VCPIAAGHVGTPPTQSVGPLAPLGVLGDGFLARAAGKPPGATSGVCRTPRGGYAGTVKSVAGLVIFGFALPSVGVVTAEGVEMV